MSDTTAPTSDRVEDALPQVAPTPPGQRGSPRLTKFILEVAMIAAGVFLGLAGDQWRESAGHRENARVALNRFRSELAANRDEAVRVKDYHARLQADLKTYLAADAVARKTLNVRLEGVQIARFERTAWDLALSTGALAYVDQEVAFSLSRTYGLQQWHADLSTGLTQAMYVRPPAEFMNGFLSAVSVYYDDMVFIEPALIKMYDEILPKLDQALGRTVAK